MRNQNKSLALQDATEFLLSHPALISDYGDFFQSNFNWFVYDLCLNNEPKEHYIKDPKKMEVRIYKEDKRFAQYFDKYKDEDDDEDTDLIYVPYKELYGCDWEYDRTEFWGEFSFFKYNTKEKVFDRLHGCHPCIKADTFEDLVIETAKYVKKIYGNFSQNDFYTQQERENHKKEDIFKYIPTKEGNFLLEPNKNYITVEDSTINLRWWNCFFKNTKEYEQWKFLDEGKE